MNSITFAAPQALRPAPPPLPGGKRPSITLGSLPVETQTFRPRKICKIDSPSISSREAASENLPSKIQGRLFQPLKIMTENLYLLRACLHLPKPAYSDKAFNYKVTRYIRDGSTAKVVEAVNAAGHRVAIKINLTSFYERSKAKLEYPVKRPIYKPGFSFEDHLETVHKYLTARAESALEGFRDMQKEEDALTTLKSHKIPNMIPLLESIIVGPLQMGLVLPLCKIDLLDAVSQKPIPLSSIRKIGRQLFETLEKLREIKWIHGDFKAENCLLTDDDKLLIADWGFAKPSHLFSLIRGTPSYLAPECLLRNEGTEKSDLWAVGCILLNIYIHFSFFESANRTETLFMMENLIGPPPKNVSTQNQLLNSQPSSFCLKGLKTRLAVLSTPCKNAMHGWILYAAKHNRELPLSADSFYDAIRPIFVYEPDKRPSPTELLNHPFFKVN